MINIKQFIILLLVSSALLGCENIPPQEKNSEFIYSIKASDSINPDINGQPSSVVVRVFQLNSPLNFERARYEDLFEPIKNTLGAEYISVNEYLVDPGMSESFEVKLSAAAKFIGVAVGYRSIDMVTWRVVQPIEEKSALDPIGLLDSSGIQILVDELSVRVVEI